MVWLPHWPRVGEVVIKEGLTRIVKILDALGNPEKTMPPVIHFAGTNGKGSTVAFVRSILESAGLRVHVYTSPHLLRYNERIRLCGQEIEDGYLESILEECRIVSEKNQIDVSFFEGTTAAAFLAFSRVKADVVLLETGLGGRLDATNVIEKPLLSVITPISLDHMNILGDNISKIAYEKACIIKKNVPCIVSMQVPQVHEVIEKYAALQDAPLFRYEYDFGCEIKKDRLIYKSDKMLLETGFPSLRGYHQFVNASTAIACVSHLSGFKVNDLAFRRGIENAKWRGRLQLMQEGSVVSKLPENWQIWVDGAHNDGGARALSSWLVDQSSDYVNVIIMGMTRNRSVESFIGHFGGIDHVIGVPVHSEPVSYSGEHIKSRLEAIGISSSSRDSLLEAFNVVSEKYLNRKVRVLVTGSLFLVSDFFVANNS